MVAFPWFQPSISGLNGQSEALEAISANIANATTDGYKRDDVTFATVMSRTVASSPGMPGTNAPINTQSDLGGVTAIDHFRISQAGAIQSTGANLDAAINGSGFFMLATDPANPSQVVYGRAGHFGLQPVAPNQSGGYLVDPNGYSVLGWPLNASGTVPAGAAPAPIVVDFVSTVDPGQATSKETVHGDLPSTAAVGSAQTTGLEAYDAAGQAYPLSLTLTKQATNVWSVAVSGGAGRTVTVAPEGAPGGPATLAFDSLGQAQAPTAFTVTVTQPDGKTASMRLDLSDIAQTGVAGSSTLSSQQDGYGAGSLKSVAFDTAGRLIGTFSNGRTRPLFQLAIADFTNPDGLAPLSGTVYGQTELSGQPSVGVAGDGPRGSIVPAAIEQSNVDLADEFSRMILVQHAYTSAATAFKTMDEMSQVARDLKQA
jgi:flagellar hook protein FlgE